MNAHPLRCALPRLGGVRRAASGSGQGIMPGVCQARPITAVYATLTVTVASNRRKQRLPLRLWICVRTSCGMTVRPIRCAMRHLEGVRRAGRRSGRGRMQDVWRARTAAQSASRYSMTDVYISEKICFLPSLASASRVALSATASPIPIQRPFSPDRATESLTPPLRISPS